MLRRADDLVPNQIALLQQDERLRLSTQERDGDDTRLLAIEEVGAATAQRQVIGGDRPRNALADIDDQLQLRQQQDGVQLRLLHVHLGAQDRDLGGVRLLQIGIGQRRLRRIQGGAPCCRVVRCQGAVE